MIRVMVACIALLASAAVAWAQLTPQQIIILFGKTSSASGSLVSSCNNTNQLVLDYSNSCALIAQGFGQ